MDQGPPPFCVDVISNLDHSIGRRYLWGTFWLGLRIILWPMQASISWVDHRQYATFSFQFHHYGINPGYGMKSPDFPFPFSKTLFRKLRKKRNLNINSFMLFLLLLFFSQRQCRCLCQRGAKSSQGQEEDKSTKINISRYYLVTSK